ncbi:hypothetical protein [Mesorhizobium huakuii]|uniref:Uncharacterized protein n=1 Tax=Mesorhizobium huakuii TaxID=28104 RepID=A0ABZ0VSA5_9HYPH|nr:hypothetical protein [Mesorhizobium huakuii]WQB99551.1 hypothetical protein U0R22_003734 [Mesorhizobium huakuii]
MLLLSWWDLKYGGHVQGGEYRVGDRDNPGGVDSIDPHGVQHDDVADLF